MTAFAGLTRTRRVVSCHGDGAKAIPIDPSFLGFAGAGVYNVRVRGDEIVAFSRGGFEPAHVLGRVCVAYVAPSGETGAASCRDVPTPAPYVYAPPFDYPRPPATLPLARALAAAVATANPNLTVEIVRHTEQRYGVTTLLALVHRKGGRGTFALCRTWGKTFVQDFEGVPWAAVEIVQAAWDRIAAAYAAEIVAGAGAS